MKPLNQLENQLDYNMKPEQLTNKLKDKIGEKVLGMPEMGITGAETYSQYMSSLSEEDDDSPIVKKKIKKSEITNLLSKNKSKMNKPIGKIFSISKGEMMEKWSQKYKDSINCENPKVFSQRAHCQGKNKKSETKEAMGAANSGGYVGKTAFDKNSDFVKKSFTETPKLDKREFKEATGSGSGGAYVTTAAWAKSTKKKDWRGKSKTLFPGGKFVQVKKKCKTFPYCNQGDINALNFTNEGKIEKIITKMSEKYNISEDYIKKLIIKEYHKGKR